MPRGRQTGWAVLLVALVAIASWWQHQDAVQRYEALLTCVTHAETTVKQSQARLREMTGSMATGIEPGLEPADRRGLFAQVAVTAAASTPALVSARRACGSIELRRWAAGQRTAHNAYLRYLDAQIEVFRTAVADGEAVVAQHPQIEQAHTEAAQALRRHAPTHTLRQRAATAILTSG